MSRIRSVHPDQWTDEAFVSCSYPARLLAIGLRNIADDGGVFPWKPLTLKMRLMPADNEDIAALLAELEAADIVRSYRNGSGTYGAIRSFAKFQKPKSPNLEHPRFPWVDRYCAGDSEPWPNPSRPVSKTVQNQEDTIAEAVPNHFGNGSEISPQGKEGRGGECMGGKRVSPDETLPHTQTLFDDEPDEPDEPAIVPPPRPSKRVRALDLLAIDDELRALAVENKREPDRELTKFRNYCLSHAKKYADYKAAFRNWLMSKYDKPDEPPPKSKTIDGGYGFGIS